MKRNLFVYTLMFCLFFYVLQPFAIVFSEDENLVIAEKPMDLQNIVSEQKAKELFLSKWAIEKEPFTLREDIEKENLLLSSDGKTTLSETVCIDWTSGEILVSMQKGYSEFHSTWTAKDFPELKIETLEDLTKGLPELRKERGIDIPPQQTLLITLKDKTREAILSACEILLERADVQSVMPNYCITTPLEKEVAKQETLMQKSVIERSLTNQNAAAFSAMNVDSAWKLTEGSGVRGAVIDNGVFPHDYLATSIEEGIDTDDPESGTADVITPEIDHGTFIAGIIAADKNESNGMVGVAPSAKIVPVQHRNVDSGIDIEKIYDIFAELERKNVLVANWSEYLIAETPEACLSLFNYIKLAIERYGEGNGVLVCTAGNKADNIDVIPEYPGAGDCSNIITVANLDMTTYSLQENSSYGSINVDIAAPGTYICSTYHLTEYDIKRGTSYAAPMVAGAVALLRSIDPDLTPEEIKEILMQTATPLVSLQGKVACGGYLNVGRAVNAVCVAYQTQFNGSGEDSFGTLETWENKNGLRLNGTTSSAEAYLVFDTVHFETITESASNAQNVYQYKRLSGPWINENVLDTSGMGMTLDLSLKLDMTPIHSTATENTPKFSLTGFIIDAHADETDREFYLCIAEYHGVSGKNVAVTSFYGNRNALNTSTTIYLNVENFDTTYHRYTFSYNPANNEIVFYLDGVYQGEFWAPTLRQSPASNKDFVCFSLVNRELNSYTVDGYQRAESVAELAFCKIYNTHSTTAMVNGLLWQTMTA